MRELLIRYLLGELRADEQRELEARLHTSLDLRRELAYLRKCFEAAQDADADGSVQPSHLAERTTRRVCDAADGADGLWNSSADRSVRSMADEPAGQLGWSLADLTVAGGAILAVAMLVLPAMRDSRDATRANMCQDHLRNIAIALKAYAADHGGSFPQIQRADNAGMFAVELVERGYVDADDLSVWLVCPSSPAATAIRSGSLVVRIPSRARLAALSGEDLAEARRTMSPCYAYALPYRIGNEYLGPRDSRRRFTPIVSDAWDGEPTQPMSSNHHGFFHTLCTDGSVQTLLSCRVPVFGDDDVYRNQLGVVAAGCSQNDSVLGRSDATPAGIEFIARPQGFGE